MANGFDMELRGQQEWSWLLAVDLFLNGLGGGLFLLFQVFRLPLFVGLLSLGLVLVGGLVLLSELGRPARAWRAISKPRTSWISRGFLMVLLFLLSGSLYFAPAFRAFSWLPWAGDSLVATILWVTAGLCALWITFYPGFVLSLPRSIPFWNNPLLPLLFFTHSAMGATGIVLLISPFSSIQESLRQLEPLAALLIVVNFVMLFVYLLIMDRSGAAAKASMRLNSDGSPASFGWDLSGAAAKESVRLLHRGTLGRTFLIGVILFGMVFPLLMIVWLQSALVLAGAGILTGGLLFRYCVLKAGVYVPFPLVGLDLSKLNRTDGEFAREYAEMNARHSPAR